MVESYLFAFLLWVLVLVSLSFAVLFALCGYVCICIDPHSTTLWVCKSENLGYQSLLPCWRQYIKKLARLWQLTAQLSEDSLIGAVGLQTCCACLCASFAGLNSGPQSCTAGLLPIEPSFQSCFLSLFTVLPLDSFSIDYLLWSQFILLKLSFNCSVTRKPSSF